MNRQIVNKNEIDKIIQRTFDYESIHRGNNMQIDVINKKDNEDFLKFCNGLTEHVHIDAIGGTKSPDGTYIRRYRTDKKFEDVVQYIKDGMRCGIKIHHKHFALVGEWNEWEDGFIEAFIRMDGNKEHNEYFIWMYIKMEHLRSILEEFSDKLAYYF